MEAVASTRRSRALEELRRLSTLSEPADDRPAEQLQGDHSSVRSRAREELRRLSTVSEPSDDRPAVQQCDHFSIRSGAREELRHLSTVSEPADDRPAVQQCDHFSIRGYVALLQQNDPKFCSLSQTFGNQQHNDEHRIPLPVEKFRLWNCSGCLDKVKISDHGTTSRAVSMEQDGCSISFFRTLMPNSVDTGRLFPCTQESSQGNNPGGSTPLKNAQESHSKCNSPSGNIGVAEMNTDPATDLQGSPNNHDVMENMPNDVSVDVTELPDVPQLVSSKSENGTQSPQSPKLCEVPNEDERTQDVLNVEPNVSDVPEPISGHNGNQAYNRGPREAVSKRNFRPHNEKKKNKPTELADISDLKICQRKPKKMRLLSEILATDLAGCSANDTEDGHANVGVHESGTSIMPSSIGNDNDTTIGSPKVGEFQPRAARNKTKLRGVDNVDDGSSLVNLLKKAHKKVRTEKKCGGHKKVGSSVISASDLDLSASRDMRQDFPSSVGDLSQNKALSATSGIVSNKNTKKNNLEENTEYAYNLCGNGPDSSKQRSLSKGESTILIKRKIPLTTTTSACHGDENTEDSPVRSNVPRTDDLCQLEPENSVQRCQIKVSQSKRDVHNVSGLHEQKKSKNRKKRKLDIHEKQTIIDDIPMDIVELLARNQHERQLMTDANALENSSVQSMIVPDDNTQVAAKDGPNRSSIVLDTNVQKSFSSEGKQKLLQCHAPSSTQAASVHAPKSHTQKPLQGHTSSSTEPANVHLPKLHMNESIQVQTASNPEAVDVHPPELSMEQEVTIACVSPTFPHHQYIAEIPTQNWSNNGAKKLMGESFKSDLRDTSASGFGAQFRPNIQEVDLASTHVVGPSNSYPTHQPTVVAIDQYTAKAVNQVQPRGFLSTVSTMETGNLYDRRTAGHSGLYPRETMPATHLLRLMDSSTASGFTNYEMPNRNRMEFQVSGSHYAHDLYTASPSTSYGSHRIERVPLTLEDLSRHQLQQNVRRPLRPHPRVGVLSTFVQQDIANWSENCGIQSGHGLGVAKGIKSFDRNRQENCEALNSGMFSAGWNALQLGSVSCVANTGYPSARYGVPQSWTRGMGKMVRALDKFVRKDICETNRNPADFTTISDDNEYMISL
ncbi:hypothetical protein ACP4OV_013343 [Aristida adscensionis]